MANEVMVGMTRIEGKFREALINVAGEGGLEGMVSELGLGTRHDVSRLSLETYETRRLETVR